MTPDRLPPRMRPHPPFADRYPQEPHEPPGAAMLNIPDLNRGEQPSKRTHPAAPPRSLSHRTYLSPVQSHPHSTVLSNSTSKPQKYGTSLPPNKTKISNSERPFTALNCSSLASIGARKLRLPEQFDCQICT